MDSLGPLGHDGGRRRRNRRRERHRPRGGSGDSDKEPVMNLARPDVTVHASRDEARRALFQPRQLRSVEDLQSILHLLSRHKAATSWMAFTSQSKAPKQHVLELCSTALALRLHPGTLVYRQDQVADTDAMYIVLKGKCSVYHKPRRARRGENRRPVVETGGGDGLQSLDRVMGSAASIIQSPTARSGAGAGGAGTDATTTRQFVDSPGKLLQPASESQRLAISESTKDLHAHGGYNGAVLPTDGSLLNEIGHAVGQLGPGQCFGETSDKSGRREYSVVVDRGCVTEVLRLNITVYRKCCPKWFKSIETTLEKRVNVLSRLYIFNDWHREDLVFLARWMVDKDYVQGEVIYDIGGPVSYVYFPHTGDVGLSFRPRRRSSGSVNPYDESHGVGESGTKLVHLEHVTPPGFFGEAEVLRKVGCRQVRATALRHTSAVLIPVNVFNKMLLSKLPAGTYGSAAKLEASLSSRDAWHHIRIREVASKPKLTELPFAFLAPFQAKIVECPLCGSRNHTVAKCPFPDGRPQSADSVASRPRSAIFDDTKRPILDCPDIVTVKRGRGQISHIDTEESPYEQVHIPLNTFITSGFRASPGARTSPQQHSYSPTADVSPTSRGSPPHLHSGPQRRKRIRGAENTSRVVSAQASKSNSPDPEHTSPQAALLRVTAFFNEPTTGKRRQRPMASQRRRFDRLKEGAHASLHRFSSSSSDDDDMVIRPHALTRAQRKAKELESAMDDAAGKRLQATTDARLRGKALYEHSGSGAQSHNQDISAPFLGFATDAFSTMNAVSLQVSGVLKVVAKFKMLLRRRRARQARRARAAMKHKWKSQRALRLAHEETKEQYATPRDYSTENVASDEQQLMDAAAEPVATVPCSVVALSVGGSVATGAPRSVVHGAGAVVTAADDGRDGSVLDAVGEGSGSDGDYSDGFEDEHEAEPPPLPLKPTTPLVGHLELGRQKQGRGAKDRALAAGRRARNRRIEKISKQTRSMLAAASSAHKSEHGKQRNKRRLAAAQRSANAFSSSSGRWGGVAKHLSGAAANAHAARGGRLSPQKSPARELKPQKSAKDVADDAFESLGVKVALKAAQRGPLSPSNDASGVPSAAAVPHAGSPTKSAFAPPGSDGVGGDTATAQSTSGGSGRLKQWRRSPSMRAILVGVGGGTTPSSGAGAGSGTGPGSNVAVAAAAGVRKHPAMLGMSRLLPQFGSQRALLDGAPSGSGGLEGRDVHAMLLGFDSGGSTTPGDSCDTARAADTPAAEVEEDVAAGSPVPVAATHRTRPSDAHPPALARLAGARQGGGGGVQPAPGRPVPALTGGAVDVLMLGAVNAFAKAAEVVVEEEDPVPEVPAIDTQRALAQLEVRMHSLQHMSSRTSGLMYSGRDLQRINKVRRAAGREPIHNRSVKYTRPTLQPSRSVRKSPKGAKGRGRGKGRWPRDNQNPRRAGPTSKHGMTATNSMPALPTVPALRFDASPNQRPHFEAEALTVSDHEETPRGGASHRQSRRSTSTGVGGRGGTKRRSRVESLAIDSEGDVDSDVEGDRPLGGSVDTLRIRRQSGVVAAVGSTSRSRRRHTRHRSTSTVGSIGTSSTRTPTSAMASVRSTARTTLTEAVAE